MQRRCLVSCLAVACALRSSASAAADEAVAPVAGAEVATPPASIAREDHTLTVGGYLQSQLKLRQDDPAVGLDEDGFRVRRARAQINHHLGFGRITVDARIEVELAAAVELEDGYVRVGGCLAGGGRWQLGLGQFIAPISRQALLSEARLGFVEKPALVGLAPERQIGLGGTLTVPYAPWLVLSAGAFDGEGKNQGGNVDQRFLWAGRVEVHPLGRDTELAESNLGGDYVVLGASAGQNRVAAGSTVEQTRTFGGDLAFGWHGVSGAVEYLEVRHSRPAGAAVPDFHANGLVAQLAYLVPLPGAWARHLEVGIRLDEIDRNDAVAIERPGDPEQSLRSFHLAATWYQRGHDLKLQVDAAHIVEVEDITRNRTDARYRNDTVLVQATYRLESP